MSDEPDFIGDQSRAMIEAWLRDYGNRSVHEVKSANMYLIDGFHTLVITYLEREEVLDFCTCDHPKGEHFFTGKPIMCGIANCDCQKFESRFNLHEHVIDIKDDELTLLWKAVVSQ